MSPYKREGVFLYSRSCRDECGRIQLEKDTMKEMKVSPRGIDRTTRHGRPLASSAFSLGRSITRSFLTRCNSLQSGRKEGTGYPCLGSVLEVLSGGGPNKLIVLSHLIQIIPYPKLCAYSFYCTPRQCLTI